MTGDYGAVSIRDMEMTNKIEEDCRSVHGDMVQVHSGRLGSVFEMAFKFMLRFL
jgi:hypothetical protein